jgi:hypothetical protein
LDAGYFSEPEAKTTITFSYVRPYKDVADSAAHQIRGSALQHRTQRKIHGMLKDIMANLCDRAYAQCQRQVLVTKVRSSSNGRHDEQPNEHHHHAPECVLWQVLSEFRWYPGSVLRDPLPKRLIFAKQKL